VSNKIKWKQHHYYASASNFIAKLMWNMQCFFLELKCHCFCRFFAVRAIRKNEETPSAHGVVWAYFLSKLVFLIKFELLTGAALIFFPQCPSTPCPHFAGGNNWVLGVEPDASDSFTRITWLKDCNLLFFYVISWLILIFSSKMMKYYGKTSIDEGPTPSSIPELPGQLIKNLMN
jgi:hypothetical protein